MNDTSFLNQIQIAKPCPARWEDMTGDDRARFCAHCQKHVYNFSALTAAQATALIREKEGQLCARLFRRRDGTVLTADCPIGLQRIRENFERRLTAVAATVTLLLSTLGLTGCNKRQPTGLITVSPATTNAPAIMGDVAGPMGEISAPVMGKPAIAPGIPAP